MDGDATTFVWDWASGIPEMLGDGQAMGSSIAQAMGLSIALYLVGHEMLGQWDGADWAYYLPDALGSIRQETDGTGAVTDSREWTPFGVEVGTAQEGLGYTGEWQNTYFESGLLYLRARWYAVKVGRFTSPDPIIADFHDPRSINRYVYVLGNPIILIDPSGLQACASYCGPDITDWFAEEVRIHWNWIQTEKGAFTAETERLYRQCLSASASETCIALHTARTEQWLISFRDYAKAIPYKWMRFRHLVPDCPTLDCWFTATLCDTCLQRSELGNIMFGFAANLWGWPAELAHSIAFLIGALQEQWDKASAGIGYHLAEGYVGNGSSSSEAMCSSMKASQGTRAFPQARWENIQDPHIEGCQSCEVPVPPSTPHSTPAFAGAPSGYRDPWAGAPNYEYYTEQIPVGMLDPLMLDPRLPGILK